MFHKGSTKEPFLIGNENVLFLQGTFKSSARGPKKEPLMVLNDVREERREHVCMYNMLEKKKRSDGGCIKCFRCFKIKLQPDGGVVCGCY